MPHPARTSDTSGRWFLVFIGLSLALIGGIFVSLMARSSLRALAMRQWQEVPCVILVSRVAERRHDDFSPIEYRHELSYGYEWHQQPYTSTSLSLRGAKWSSQEGRAAELQSRYPVGMRTVCRVNPADPALAVIERESLAPAYSIWFPALFVVGGLGIALRALRGERKGC